MICFYSIIGLDRSASHHGCGYKEKLGCCSIMVFRHFDSLAYRALEASDCMVQHLVGKSVMRSRCWLLYPWVAGARNAI
jgi:hypothetical protein